MATLVLAVLRLQGSDTINIFNHVSQEKRDGQGM
jgi:hypothetical protein